MKALEKYGIVSIKKVKSKNNQNTAAIELTRKSSNPETLTMFKRLRAQLRKEKVEFDPLQVDSNKENAGENTEEDASADNQ